MISPNSLLSKSAASFFYMPFQSEVFYSTEITHNHLIQEEKKQEKFFRILLLSWEFPPAVIGGLGMHVWELSKSLVQAGHEVYVITPSFVGAPPYERMDNIHIFRGKEFYQTVDDFHLFAARTNMNLVESALDLASKIPFDLIHAHDWMVGMAARALKATLFLPVVTTIHALESGRTKSEGLTDRQLKSIQLERDLLAESDQVIVCSFYMKHEISETFPSLTKEVHVIPNGVKVASAPIHKSIQQLLKRYHYSHLIFAMGRLVPEKGFETFISAAVQVLKRHPATLFVIAGKGPLLSGYQDLAAKLGLEKSILFVGYLHEREKRTMLHYCDVLVVPSLYEPFGIVALEGMAAEKPVIASHTGGLASILDEETGVYFPPGDDGKLAEAIEALLVSPLLREELGRNAKRKAIEKYNWEDVRKQTEAVYAHTMTTSSVQ